MSENEAREKALGRWGDERDGLSMDGEESFRAGWDAAEKNFESFVAARVEDAVKFANEEARRARDENASLRAQLERLELACDTFEKNSADATADWEGRRAAEAALVASLRAERDTARNELEDYRPGLAAFFGVYTADPRHALKGLAGERDALRAERDAAQKTLTDVTLERNRFRIEARDLRAQLEALNTEMDRRAEDSLGRERELKAALNSAQASVAREVNAERERDAIRKENEEGWAEVAKLGDERNALKAKLEEARKALEDLHNEYTGTPERAEQYKWSLTRIAFALAALSDSKPTPEPCDSKAGGKRCVRLSGHGGHHEANCGVTWDENDAEPTPEVAKPDATHTLKVWPQFFEAIKDGRKTFEARKDDRGFKVGDSLLLREWVPEESHYTGRFALYQVTYILRGPAFGVEGGHCIMALGFLGVAPPTTTHAPEPLGFESAPKSKEECVCDVLATGPCLKHEAKEEKPETMEDLAWVDHVYRGDLKQAIFALRAQAKADAERIAELEKELEFVPGRKNELARRVAVERAESAEREREEAVELVSAFLKNDEGKGFDGPLTREARAFLKRLEEKR